MLVQIVAQWAGEGGPGAAPGELQGTAHVDKGPPAQLPVHLPPTPSPLPTLRSTSCVICRTYNGNLSSSIRHAREVLVPRQFTYCTVFRMRNYLVSRIRIRNYLISRIQSRIWNDQLRIRIFPFSTKIWKFLLKINIILITFFDMPYLNFFFF